MLKLRQAVVVEGKYDKIKLAGIIDAVIITTEGFEIYRNRSKLDLIRKYAHSDGVVVLTDSDNAGRQIRNFLHEHVGGNIVDIYLPEIFGKEKRKATPSSAGTLGVEGVDAKIIEEAFRRAGIGINPDDAAHINKKSNFLDRARMYDDGLIGMDRSSELRRQVLKSLSLPTNLSVSAMLDAVNRLYTNEEYEAAIAELRTAK